MRYVTPQTQALLNQKLGTEVMVLVEVDWVDDTPILYSDQELDGAQPDIVSMGGFDTSMMLSGSTDTQELNVVLNDTEGDLRILYNTNDMHKRPARVYILHKGLPVTQRTLLFRGEVVTPLDWDEAQRTMSFNILSKLDSTQVGFSMEEGDFPNIPEEALGKAWPLVFGQVCHLPAVKVRAPRRGYLESGIGIHDFTLEPRICQAVNIQCPSQSTGNQSYPQQGANNVWTNTVEKTIGPDLECVNRRFGEICKLKDLLEQQTAYEKTTITIFNGVSFPQAQPVTIFIDNATFGGSFSGNVFTITSQKHPEYDTFNHVACQSVPELGYGYTSGRPAYGGSTNVAQNSGGYWQITQQGGAAGQHQGAVWVPSSNGTVFTANQNQGQAFASCDAALIDTPGMTGGPKESWALYNAMESSSFFWAPAGSEVYMESESEILYIVSLLPGVVDGVAAYRTASNGFRYLTEVPTSYYTVYETDYDGYDVVEIGLNKALTLYDDSWEDQLYVSFTSSVGPSPCDIIEWLVDKYTDLTVDATTFAAVKAYLTNYPNNFYLTSRPDVYKLINDIAYQSRCALFVRNDVVYITYLSLEPTSVRTINEADILFGTFKESLSQTEEVYTTHNINWEKAGAAVRDDKSIEQKLILKYNVDKYGTVEQDWDYYTYNIYELVLKSSTFWLIRKANSWKRVEFDLPLKHIDLDVGDCVTLNVTQFGSPVKVVIEQSTYDPDKNTVSLECWTPIRSGETEAYHWAWPSQQPAPGVWPMPLDTHGGGGYNFNVSPPTGHILLGGAHRDDQLIISSGDLHPSDLDDTLPTVECELSDYVNFNETPPEIEAKQIAQSAAQQAMENGMTGGGNAGGAGDDKKTTDSCGDSGGGCNYKVNVLWHRSAAQGQATIFGGSKPGGPCGGPCNCTGGCPSCFGPFWFVCHTFGSPSGANGFAGYMTATYGHPDGWWECNEVGVWQANASDGTHSASAGDCGSVGDGDIANSGTESTEESGTPTGLTGDELT
jgi:hypothetical protein